MEFSVTELFEAVATALPDRDCIVWRGQRLTFAEVLARTRAFARFLIDAGVRTPAPRDGLDPWESGQDHVALYLHNSPAFLESMLGSFRARAVPLNINYRYVAEEVRYVLADAGAKALVYNNRYAPVVSEVLADLPELQVLIHVDDGSGVAPCAGSVDYTSIVARACDAVGADPSPDDLYIVYTGGTTGMPKGTMWRQADAIVACFSMSNRVERRDFSGVDEIVRLASRGSRRVMPVPPFMHGASQWSSFNTLLSGGTVVIQSNVDRLDAAEVWATAAAESANAILIVGEAFGRPLAEALPDDVSGLSGLRTVLTGGAALTEPTRRRLLDRLPQLSIADVMGSSESGQVMTSVTAAGDQDRAVGLFEPSRGTAILDETRSRLLPTDDPSNGWLARTGRIPLGYLGDRTKTENTFVTVDGTRWAILGDRASYAAGGLIQMYGRESVTINSGGEKIFAEEVERAILAHPDVVDVVVVGRPSERWGQEVVAVAQVHESVSDEDLLAVARQKVAPYKLPKAIVRVDQVKRSPAGKADYAWARDRAIEHHD